MSKVWKIRNKKTGLFFLDGSNQSSAEGMVFTSNWSANREFKNLVLAKMKGRRKRIKDESGRTVEFKRVAPKNAVEKAFEWEVVEYDLTEASAKIWVEIEDVFERISEEIDPRDIVKYRKEQK